ncbi:hypothetical protein PAECIP112173_01374 [Paenibacillus sp. JJ-100]|nr:hypothetical protein PAECIP112173_01374 [Paenibacillus sp. JJ-100]
MAIHMVIDLCISFTDENLYKFQLIIPTFTKGTGQSYVKIV